tara:strand:- start:13259 stop:13579 length:321 start_codon:yes stop_codon:yes gene_type:complete
MKKLKPWIILFLLTIPIVVWIIVFNIFDDPNQASNWFSNAFFLKKEGLDPGFINPILFTLITTLGLIVNLILGIKTMKNNGVGDFKILLFSILTFVSILANGIGLM